MPRLLNPCPQCQKSLEVKNSTPIGSETLLEYKCGHTFLESQGLSQFSLNGKPVNYDSLTGTKRAFEFQKEGVEFVFKSNFNCLIADPMGLGKTIQALLAAREGGFKRILVLCKASCGYQWFEESKEWLSNSLWSAFLVQGTKNFIPPGFNIYIMSMDTMSRMTKDKTKFAEFKALDFDMIIVDEAHSFKNPDSSRSQALVAFLRDISHTEIERVIKFSCPMCRHGWTENGKVTINLRDNKSSAQTSHTAACPACKAFVRVSAQKDVLDEAPRQKLGLILLSGTPIKNRADEYFVALNLLRPGVFTSLSQFQHSWLQQDPYSGKYNRFLPWKFQQFEEMTKSFIIRRDKSKVLSLPPFRRAFETIYIEDKDIKIAYNKELANLASAAGKSNFNFFDVQDSLMTLRRITGMAKCSFATEYVDTFLETVEDEKIAIGIHHEAVRDNLFYALETRGFQPLKLSGEDSAEKKNWIQKQFTNEAGKRALIINMIAGGVGLNLQVCNNILVLERQWNAADEEQFEGRFNRQGQTRPVLAEYMIAKGTIDEYFSNLVESKRQICGETLDGWDFTTDRNALRDLVEETVSHRL